MKYAVKTLIASCEEKEYEKHYDKVNDCTTYSTESDIHYFENQFCRHRFGSKELSKPHCHSL